MQKTAVMFSGIDGLDKPGQRFQVLKLPDVQHRLQEAHHLLRKYSNNSVSLNDYAFADEETYHANLAMKAILGAVVHVGLYDRLLKFHPTPNFLVGCSLGDSARTVCAGAMSFEKVMLGTYLYGLHGQNLRSGSVVCVKSLFEPLSRIEIELIESHGLYLAVYQTPKHFLVGGPNDTLNAWIEAPSTQALYSIRPLCEYPLHSIAMKATQEFTFENFGDMNIQKWQVPMVSAANSRLIQTEDELIADMTANMTGPVRWHQTYTWMIKHLGVRKFINIGPAETLIRFHERMELDTSVEVIDSLQVENSFAVEAVL